jgi:hypothetical protein
MKPPGKPECPQFQSILYLFWQNDLSPHHFGSCDGRIHVTDLEPQEQTITRRHVVWIAD